MSILNIYVCIYIYIYILLLLLLLLLLYRERHRERHGWNPIAPSPLCIKGVKFQNFPKNGMGWEFFHEKEEVGKIGGLFLKKGVVSNQH